jgi:hypothetical protein
MARQTQRAAPMAKLTISCHDFKPLYRNTLRGFVAIRIGELRLDVKDIAIHAKGNSRWAALPAKPMIDRDGAALRDSTTGKILYNNIFEFADRATRNAFSDAVVAAVLDRFPNAFKDGEAAA